MLKNVKRTVNGRLHAYVHVFTTQVSEHCHLGVKHVWDGRVNVGASYSTASEGDLDLEKEKHESSESPDGFKTDAR